MSNNYDENYNKKSTNTKGIFNTTVGKVKSYGGGNTVNTAASISDTVSGEGKTSSGVPKGSVGIRDTLTGMGFSNKSIGYNENDRTVTLNGKKLMKPKYVDEERGISYSDKGDIEKSLVDYYSQSSNPIVRVTDAYAAAAGSYGLSADGLSYGNGTVMIGGVPLNTLYVDDNGKAWAWQDDVEDLTRSYAKSYGIKVPSYIADRYENKYLSDVWDAIDDLRSREDFSYDPDDDPVYQAYARKYLTEGDRATKNAVAKYSALTGGYVNSAAATAGSLANSYYVQQLSDMVPSLAAQAYERYMDTYQTELNAIDKMTDVYSLAYKNASEANNQTVSNINSVSKSTTDRDNAAYERQRDSTDNYWDNLLKQQKYDTTERDNYWSEIFNEQTSRMNESKNEGYELNNITSKLTNEQKEIFNEYYNRLLEAELEGDILSNSLARAQLGMYGY